MSFWDTIKKGAQKFFAPTKRAEQARQQKMTGGNTNKTDVKKVINNITKHFTTPSRSQAQQQKLWGSTRTTTNHSNVVQSVLNKPKTPGSSLQLPINNGQTYRAYAKYNQKAGNKLFTTIRNRIKRANDIDYPSFFGNGYSYAKAAEDAQKLGEELQGKNLTMSELGHNAAMLHTKKDVTQLKSHLIDGQFNQPGLHDNIIGWGQNVLLDQGAVNDWILSGTEKYVVKDGDTYFDIADKYGISLEELAANNNITNLNSIEPGQKLNVSSRDEQLFRLNQVNYYFGNAGRTGNAYNIVDTFDPETKEYVKQSQIRVDAPLPPWIIPNKTNLEWWEYYKQYSHDVVQAAADAYLEAKEEARVQKVNPYKAAFANSTDPDAVNSFSDVLIDAFGAKGGISGKYEKLARGTATYLNEYVFNPIKEGHFLTAAGNAVYNMMETMDIAARGVRAFTAGDQALGGAGGTWSKTEYHFGDGTRGFLHTSGRNNDAKFEGQDVYWANIEGHDIEDIKKAQRLFMDNGGYALLLGANQNEATKAQLGSGDVASRPEERAEIVRRLDTLFAGSDINWRLIYDDINKNYFSKDKSVKDLKRGIENVKESYTDRNAMFNADTGSLAADMVIEMALDPGLLVGGGAKAAAGGAVNTAARTGVEEGFKAVLRSSDDVAELTKNKNIQKALKGLINSNEGKNIIFKHADKFDEDLQLFIRSVKANNDTIFSTKAAEDTFKNVVTSHLMGKNRSINGMIIGSVKNGDKTVWGTHFAREALDTKAFKAAYYLDKAVDGVDSAIIKSSFFLPWAGVKGVKMGINTIDNVMHTPTVSKAMARLGLDKADAARAIVNEMTQEVDVTKVKNLLYKADANEVKKSYVRNALQFAVKEQDDVARETNSILNSFIRGEINADDALKLVEDSIGKITAGRYKSVDDFKAFIDNLAPRYTSDVKRSFDRINKNYDKLKNAIDRRSEDRVVDFLERVRQVKDADELKVLFREHMDNAFIRDLRDEVVDAAPFNITSDEVGAIVDDIRLNGLFAETSLDRSITERGIQGIKKTGARTVDRTVGFEEFGELLKKDLGIDWKKVDFRMSTSNPNQISTLERYIVDFMSEWSKNDSITYNIQDAIKIVDKFERKVHFKVLMGETKSALSATTAHAMTGEFTKLRQSLKKIDVVSLKDAKVVTLLHTDRMAFQQEIIRSKDIQDLYGGFYDDVIAPVLDTFRGKNTDEVDLMDGSLFADISELAKQKYGYDRTSQLVEEARYLAGFSDEQLYSFMNTLATDFKFTDDMGNIDLAPGMLRNKVEATFRAQMGESKIGKKNMLDILQSANSDQPNAILAPYIDELSDPANKARYDAVVNKDILDPSGDVERQMIFAALADPTIVDEWNALARKGEPPVFMHVNTTGLNSEINSISSVSLRKWVPINVSEDDPLTLTKLLDAMDAGETKVFQRYMSDAEIDGVSEQVLRRLDMKGLDAAQLRKVYKEFYGINDANAYKSELDVLEEVSDFLLNSSVTKEGTDGVRLASPSLVVHDLDGFNVSYLNNKLTASRSIAGEDSKIASYLDNLSGSSQRNSYNTYHRLASMVGDSAYTEDQINSIVTLLQDYIDDINQFAKGYRFNDVRSYSQKLSDLVERTRLKADAGVASDSEKQFIELYENSKGGARLYKYNNAVKSISNLTINPRGYAFITSDLDDNLVKAALQEAGRTSVNVDTRIYVDDVLSYFDLDVADGFNVNIEDLKKMHEMSQYVIKTRDRQIVLGAEEFLSKYKSTYDSVIQSCIDMSRSGSFEGTELSYLQNMKVPGTAVESYLMAKKLYGDHIKYWLDTDAVTSLHRDGAALDAMKMRLNEQAFVLGKNSASFKLEERRVFEEACDYVNNHRKRLMDELAGGMFGVDVADDALDVLEGAHAPEIYNWAARADYEKKILKYKDGVLSEGIDAATRYSEANSEITSNLRQLSHIDDVYVRNGLGRKQDRLVGSIYMKAKQLFDVLDQTKIARRESFQNFINKATEINNLRVQQARYKSLLTDGKLDRNKLISEVLWNDFNMVAFNSHNYYDEEISELSNFIKKLQDNGDDFLSYYEDKSTGNVYVYLNTKAGKVSDADDGFRYINGSERFARPAKGSIPLADFDELAEVLDLDDLEDFREIYAQLRSCWDDTVLLSSGRINGTTGRTVSRKQAEEFLASLPSGMNDYLTSQGLLQFETMRGVIYDPGFVRSDSADILTDYLDTLKHQADVAKDDCVLTREIFTKEGDNLQFTDLAQNFTDDELYEYFGKSSDYVVCTIQAGGNTASGLQIRQVNMSNLNAVHRARYMENTTILPYDMYYEISNYMNRSATSSPVKRMLGKYLVAYKAFALVKPGTWMRNYIDATTKAALDSNEGMLTGFAQMLQYEMQAVRNMGTYMKILKSDPSLLTKSNWDIIQRSFGTDMPFEDFQLLRGILDGNDRFTSASKYFVNDTATRRAGHNVISGENIGLRNLDEEGFEEAFKKYLSKEIDLPLSKEEFKAIYFGQTVPDEVGREQFESMFRQLSMNMRNADMSTMFDKTINNMFKPFSYVESVVRYAQTMMLSDQGLSSNQILRRIHQTQFYNAPTWGAFNKLETIMPFVTFRYNNMMYWMRMFDENPRYFRYFEDIYRNITDDTIESIEAQGSTIDYEDDFALRSGGIPIGAGHSYFNVNSSFLNAMNDFYVFPTDVDSLSPLLKDTVRLSMYALGLNSSKFFSEVDLDFSDDDFVQKMLSVIPGYSLAKSGVKTFNNIKDQCSEDGGPSMSTLVSTLNFLGILGTRNVYTKNANFSFQDWRDELEAQGKWYDLNDGKIKDISEKNEYGANDPNNSFEDVQAYMLTHFGKIWDANQHKFVTMNDYIPGGWNDGFDWENDPEGAWENLQAYMKEVGKVYDYNQRKFVLEKDYISGGLNDPNISWDKKLELMADYFPNLRWDANQNTFVDRTKYIEGGLNDLQGLEGQAFLRNFNKLKSYRLALFGETYDRASHKFVKTTDPMVVLPSYYTDRKNDHKYDRYFSLLGISRMQTDYTNYTVSSDGLLMTKDGKYVLTGIPEHDTRIFDRVGSLYGYSGRRGRRYSGWKNYSYNKTQIPKKPYKGNPAFYQTGFGWNENEGYYRLEYSKQFQYHSPQPASKVRRVIVPPKFYPYGGGYSKFSFYRR